jgi:hypothetical protein
MIKKLAFAMLGFCAFAQAQIPAPQVPITGTIGSGGVFPLLNGGPMVISSCPHSLTYAEASAFVIKVTSTVTLGSPCVITAPLGYYSVFVENLTTGGQSVVWGGTTGTSVTIPNGQWAVVLGDMTNYGSVVASGGSGVSSISFSPPIYASGSTGAVTANCNACAFYNLGLPTSTLPLHSTASSAIVVAAAIGLASTDVSGVLPAAEMTPLGASGGSHSAGIAPDPGATAGTTRFLREDSTWAVPAGSGGGLSSFTTGNLNPLFTATLGGSPTTAPALAFTLANASQNYFFAGPATGGTGTPSYRAIVGSDIPTLNQNTTGNAATATNVPWSGLTGTAPSVTINSTACPVGGSCTISGGGGGTVNSFAAPSGSWPTWLVPTVTNSTTTPSLAVAASAIPNTVLANSSMTLNGTPCALGATCTVPSSGTTAFSSLSSATNTSAAMVVGTGASLSVTGTGTIAATSVPFTGVTGVATVAQLPTSIPNTNLANPATTVNGQTCTLGATCTITAAPATEVRAYQLAVTSGGVAYFNGATPYSTQQPQAGAVAPATSSLGYVAFNAAATNPQYLEFTVQPPPYWTGSDAAITFFASAVTGNVTWELQTACPQFNVAPGAPTFTSPQPITTAVSTTTNGLVSTTILTNIAAPTVNSCTAGTTTLGTPLTIRLFRANGGTDTAASDADAISIVLLTHRSQ